MYQPPYSTSILFYVNTATSDGGQFIFCFCSFPFKSSIYQHSLHRMQQRTGRGPADIPLLIQDNVGTDSDLRRLPSSSPTHLRRHELDMDPVLVVFVLSFPHFICPSIGTSTVVQIYSNADGSRTEPIRVLSHLWSGDDLGTKSRTLILSKVILHLGSGDDTSGSQPGARWVASRECTRWLKYVLAAVVIVC